MNSFLKLSKKNAGVSAVEIVVGVSILAVVVLFSLQALSQFLTMGQERVVRTQAVYLTEEALEAVRFVRDDDWATFAALPVDTDLYVAFTTSPSAIALTATPQQIGEFTTTLRLQEVCRNGVTHDIESGPCGAPDSETRLMTATTTWTGGSVALSQYLANLEP